MKALIYDASIPIKGKNIDNRRESIPLCRFAVDAVPAESIGNVIGKLRARGTGYTHLAFCGHAAQGFFGVAGNTNPDTGAQRETYDKKFDFLAGRLHEIADELKDLRSILADDAIVLLSGCKVAAKDKGLQLLLDLSGHLPGIWVVGAVQDTAVLHNDSAQTVELQYAVNQRNIGLLESLSLRGVKDGKEIDMYDFPDELTEITSWSTQKASE